MTLSSPVTILPGIGPSTATKLSNNLNIATLWDLLYHLPFRYEDRSHITYISQVRVGDTVTIFADVDFLKNQLSHRGRFLQIGQISDSTGFLTVVWFNQSYLPKTLKPGTKIALYGKIEFYSRKPALISPDYEIISENHPLIHIGAITPIYPETKGISSKWLRIKIHALLQTLDAQELFPNPPPELPPWQQAITNIHFPKKQDQVVPAHRRLAFDELFLLHLEAIKRKDSWNHTKLTHPLSVNQDKVLEFISSLPFTLTPTQNQAVKEILSDLQLPHPANRLLEGDVGSGKTVVAAIAAYVAHLNGFQTLLLAPTQILATQHFNTLNTLFKPFGLQIGLVTAGFKFQTCPPDWRVIVGTHALLSPNLNFSHVGLVVIDEQHRFGVAQRALATAMGNTPHILTMTATPIPRTVALTLHGDLDLSTLSSPPSGRLPIKTWVVPETKRPAAYAWIAKEISTNHTQCFIVCPFIEPSESLTTVKAASAEFAKLQTVFPNLKLDLLHGRLKSKDKDEVINRFRAGESNILVTTPVVEVGIDIPNAAIMMIEGADRFGLAQLHQLRGRVGRSDLQSYCLLFADSESARLKAMETHSSGLELSEIDFKLRGPGQIYGTAQHGVPQFKVASYDDLDLISQAKKAAETAYPNLQKYPILRSLLTQGKIEAVQPN
jgi:ATP-dependent DNA helicase RecG